MSALLNSRNPLFTQSVKRIALWNMSMFLATYIVFSILEFIVIGVVLRGTYDDRLKHEMIRMHLMVGLDKKGDFELKDRTELREPDFRKITQNPLFLQIRDVNGNTLLTSDNVVSFGHEIPFSFTPTDSSDVVVANNINSQRLRSIYSPIKNSKGEIKAIIQITTNDSHYYGIFSRIVWLNILAIPIMLIFVVVLSIFLAKKSYKNLRHIVDTAANISENNLNLRINIKADPSDEFGKLRDTLNSLFDRLQHYITQITHFTNNASHQLLTPLTALKSEVDYVLRKERTEVEYRNTLYMVRTQTERMIKIIKSLLIIAGVRRDSDDGFKRVFEMSKVINRDIRPLYESRNVKFDIPSYIYIKGIEDFFSMAIENLIENALKYSEKGDPVEVVAIEQEHTVAIAVKDLGKGIPDSEKEKIFERFYRSNSAEMEGIKGYGLGLSIVKAIIESLNGTILVEDNQPNGTVMKIILTKIEFD